MTRNKIICIDTYILILISKQFRVIEIIRVKPRLLTRRRRDAVGRAAVRCGRRRRAGDGRARGHRLFGQVENVEQLTDALVDLPLSFVHARLQLLERLRAELLDQPALLIVTIARRLGGIEYVANGLEGDVLDVDIVLGKQTARWRRATAQRTMPTLGGPRASGSLIMEPSVSESS